MGRKTGRTRPRKRSMFMGTLEWLLVREAALRILMPMEDLPENLTISRRQLCEQDSYHLRRDMTRLLRKEKWRAEWPQPDLFTAQELARAEHHPPLRATSEP